MFYILTGFFCDFFFSYVENIILWEPFSGFFYDKSLNFF